MQAPVMLSFVACALLVTGSHNAAALATASVFSQPALINDRDGPAIVASAAGVSNNLNIGADLSASADVASGLLRLALAASPKRELIGPSASASAILSDTLTLIGPGSSAVPVTFLFDVDAALAASDGTYRLNFAAEIDLTGPAAPLSQSLAIERFRSPEQDSISCSGAVCSTLNVPLTKDGLIDATIVYEALLAPGQAYDLTASLRAQMQGTAGTNLSIDASHTGRLTAILPAGYAFDSASGVFLSAVPLPAGVWLFASALGCVAARRITRPS